MALTIQKRQELRHNLLVELYNHYFEKPGIALVVTKEELRADKEKDLAYQYLLEKGLINVTHMGNSLQIKPTVRGIDYVESNHIEQVVSNEPDNTAQAYMNW